MQVRSRTQAERREATRAALLDSAARVFAHRGYHAATLDDVAKDARLTKGAVYHHFDGKESLFLALAEDRLDRRAAQLPAAAAATAAGGAATVDALPYDRDWALLFLDFIAFGARRPAFRRALRQRVGAFRAHAELTLAARAAEEGWGPEHSPERLAALLGALANGVSVEALLADDEEEAGAIFALGLDLMLSGLRAGPDATPTARTPSPATPG